MYFGLTIKRYFFSRKLGKKKLLEVLYILLRVERCINCKHYSKTESLIQTNIFLTLFLFCLLQKNIYVFPIYKNYLPYPQKKKKKKNCLREEITSVL